MSSRRSRPRLQTALASEPTPADPFTLGALNALGAAADPAMFHRTDPTQTAQLRALEAGWDELLT